MKINLLLAILIISLGFSCTNPNTEQQSPSENTENHSSFSNEVVLNEGQRWLANPETTTGVANMVEMMEAFAETENLEAYAVLSETLKEEFILIFQNFTMTGEAHNQLHNYLFPIKDMLKPLASEDLKECQETYENLYTHLQDYGKYFE